MFAEHGCVVVCRAVRIGYRWEAAEPTGGILILVGAVTFGSGASRPGGRLAAVEDASEVIDKLAN